MTTDENQEETRLASQAPQGPEGEHLPKKEPARMGELLGGKRITRAAVEKHSKCFPQPRIAFSVGGHTSQHVGEPGTGRPFVVA